MKFDIIGIGSALVDITIPVDDDFLKQEKLPKGGMTLVDAERSDELYQRFQNNNIEMSPGGATANVISSFASCGGNAAFIGKVGSDTLASFFETQTEKQNVSFLKVEHTDLMTGRVLTFITDDGQRTFATYLGAASDLTPSDLPNSILNQAPILHVEAYLVFNPELLQYILDIAKTNNQKISMDLSSFNVVETNLETFKKMVEEDIDIIFANEDESLAFTGLDTKQSLNIFKNHCEISVVKEGANGSYIAHEDNITFTPSFKVDLIDTNGAGDAYAGGVLYGLSKKLSIKDTGLIGSKAGSLIVSQKGARLTKENLDKLNAYAKQFS